MGKKVKRKVIELGSYPMEPLDLGLGNHKAPWKGVAGPIKAQSTFPGTQSKSIVSKVLRSRK